jgi:hypothetical protein
MARSVIKFNISDIFLDGQTKQEDRLHLVNSPLFGILANLYNRSEKSIRVGMVTRSEATNDFYSVEIVTPEGLSVARLTARYGGMYNFGVYSNPLTAGSNPNAVITSSNPKYLQTKLGPKSEHEAAQIFDTRLVSTKVYVSELLRASLDKFIDHTVGISVTSSPKVFSDRYITNGSELELCHYLALYYAGEVTQLEMPQNVRNMFDDIYKKYADKKNKFSDALSRSREMFSGEKWIYFRNMNGGVVLGAIRTDAMQVAIDKYASGQHLPFVSEFNYAQWEMPLKWYPSHDHIPADIRQQVDLSLVMLKAHRDSEEMFPSDGRFWEEMGCLMESYDSGPLASRLYVLSK